MFQWSSFYRQKQHRWDEGSAHPTSKHEVSEYLKLCLKYSRAHSFCSLHYQRWAFWRGLYRLSALLKSPKEGTDRSGLSSQNHCILLRTRLLQPLLTCEIRCSIFFKYSSAITISCQIACEYFSIQCYFALQIHFSLLYIIKWSGESRE